MKKPVAGPEGGKKGSRGKRGLKRHKNRSPGAIQGFGPVGLCREMGDFVRIMGKFLKRENSFPDRFAKDFLVYLRMSDFCVVRIPSRSGVFQSEDAAIIERDFRDLPRRALGRNGPGLRQLLFVCHPIVLAVSKYRRSSSVHFRPAGMTRLPSTHRKWNLEVGGIVGGHLPSWDGTRKNATSAARLDHRHTFTFHWNRSFVAEVSPRHGQYQ